MTQPKRVAEPAQIITEELVMRGWTYGLLALKMGNYGRNCDTARGMTVLKGIK